MKKENKRKVKMRTTIMNSGSETRDINYVWDERGSKLVPRNIYNYTSSSIFLKSFRAFWGSNIGDKLTDVFDSFMLEIAALASFFELSPRSCITPTVPTAFFNVPVLHYKWAWVKQLISKVFSICNFILLELTLQSTLLLYLYITNI